MIYMTEKVVNFKNRKEEKTKELMNEWQNEQNNFDSVLAQKEMIYNNTGNVTEDDIDEIFDAMEKLGEVSEKIHKHMKKKNIEV